MSTVRTHRVAFHGSVRWAELVIGDGDVVVTDRDSAANFASHDGCVFVDEQRPSPAAVAAVRDAIVRSAPARVTAVGGGCAIDTAKLAWLDAGDESALVVAPCGREMWRAFAAFAVVLDPPGGQTTTVDERIATPNVVVAHRLIESVSDDTLLLAALDMLVAAAESLLTRKAQPYAKALANAAGMQLIGAIGAALDGGRADAESVIVASALAAEAFTSTGLGLAHAISTNVGARLHLPQDRINVIAGRWVLARWSQDPALSTLQHAAHRIDTRQRSVRELIDAGAAILGLGTLHDEGLGDGDVEAVLPRINESSGIPWLPDELRADEIQRAVLELCEPEGTGVRAGVG